MRVEGQGKAIDYAVSSLNVEQVKPVNEREQNSEQTKITVTEVKKLQHPHEKEIITTTSVINEVMTLANYHLQFKVHKESGRIQVKVIDSESEKVIREIPPEKILECSAMIRKLLEDMAGVLLDEVV